MCAREINEDWRDRTIDRAWQINRYINRHRERGQGKETNDKRVAATVEVIIIEKLGLKEMDNKIINLL